jgi:hypothetical protein
MELSVTFPGLQVRKTLVLLILLGIFVSEISDKSHLKVRENIDITVVICCCVDLTCPPVAMC